MSIAVDSDGPDARYAAYLAQRRFLIQKCGACGAHIFYPRIFCLDCGSDTLHWVEPSGMGTVYSTTTVRLDPANPYNVALVEIDEGVRMMTRVDQIEPQSVQIGMRVRARVVTEKAQPLVTFVPVAEGA